MHKQVRYLLHLLNTCTNVLRFCSLVAMLRRRRTGRKAGGVSCFIFQNECNKVEIALRVVQFWSEIKLVITNRTPANHALS